MFIDKLTGLTSKDNNSYILNVKYESELTNPNLHIVLERRDYTSIYNNIYNKVNLLDYITDKLTSTNTANEYYLAIGPASNINYSFHFKENLVSGTYRLVVSLYDDNNYIGDVYQYIIIK